MQSFRYEPAPARVFVVWHPHFQEGQGFFKGLYEWLGGPGRDLHRRGLGVPVHPWTSSAPDEPPLPLPLAPDAENGLIAVVLLLDGEFLGRTSWRRWIESVAGSAKGKKIVLLPWAVHHGSARVAEVNLLQLLGSGVCETKMLRRRVTEACVVWLRDRIDPRPLKLFISYARTDGAELAGAVRRALQEYGQLAVFLDEHDLQPGRKWREDLERELSTGTAMFAIVTDAYAKRAWCREELRQFRVPRQDRSNQWWLRPVFILDNLSGEATRSMFEVGSAPTARWNPDRATDIVDEMVREVLFAEANRLRAKVARVPDGAQIINWVPDTWTLLELLRQLPHANQYRVAYPGDGLPRVELGRLSAALPSVRLSTYEELRQKAPPPKPSRRSQPRPSKLLRRPVLFSISDPPLSHLFKIGFHQLHIDDAAVRIARAILYEGYDIMYGGQPRTGFTDGFQDDSGTVVVEPRFINYLGWPYSKSLRATQVADAFGVTRYVKIRWPNSAKADSKDPWAIAQAATYTRRAAVYQRLQDLDERNVGTSAGLVALGGQVQDFAGFLPGVAEEVGIAIEAGLPVFVLGGFGGAAREVAIVLAGTPSPTLTKEAFGRGEKYPLLVEAATRVGKESKLDERIGWLMRQLNGPLPDNGLTQEENRDLWQSTDLGRIVLLIGKGLRARRSQRTDALKASQKASMRSRFRS